MCRNQVFLVFANNATSKHNKKKISNTFLYTLVSRKRVRSFSKRFWTLGYLELVKDFSFSDKMPGFSKLIELCQKFCMRFCITILVLPSYNKISPLKTNFISTTQATLRRIKDFEREQNDEYISENWIL